MAVVDAKSAEKNK